MSLIKAIGTVRWDDTNLRVMYSPDLVKYYYWFLERHFMFSMNTPAHSAHTTIINSSFDHHKNISKDMMKRWHNKKVEIEYEPHIVVGGFKKDFRNFYLVVHSKQIDDIARELKIPKPRRGWHITVANTKNDGKVLGTRPFYGKMITINYVSPTS